MSDSAQIIMRLDPLSDAERIAAVQGLARWLLDTAVLAVFDDAPPQRAQHARTDWSPGPLWRDAVDEVPGAVFESLWLNGVDLTADVGMHSALTNFEEWACPRCGTELESTAFIEQWIDTRVEPVATCAACDWAARLGDWPGDFPAVLVGGPSVVFHNWHPLRPDFVIDITERLGGGRCRYFWQRS